MTYADFILDVVYDFKGIPDKTLILIYLFMYILLKKK